MKEGTIIPYQNTTEKAFNTTADLIKDKGLDLLVFPDSNGFAEGTVFIDSKGDNQTELDNSIFKYYKIRFSNRTVTITLDDGFNDQGKFNQGNHLIKNIYILNQKKVIFIAYSLKFSYLTMLLSKHDA